MSETSIAAVRARLQELARSRAAQAEKQLERKSESKTLGVPQRPARPVPRTALPASVSNIIHSPVKPVESKSSSGERNVLKLRVDLTSPFDDTIRIRKDTPGVTIEHEKSPIAKDLEIIDEASRHMNLQIHQLQQELEDQKRALEHLENAKNQEIARLQEELREVTRDSVQNEKWVDELKSACRQKDESLQTLELQVSDLNESKQRMEKQIESLNNELINSQNEMDNLVAESEEQKLRAEISLLKEMIEENRVAQAQADADHIISLENLQNSINALNLEKESLEDKFNTEYSELQKENLYLKSKLEMRDSAKLSSRLSMLRASSELNSATGSFTKIRELVCSLYAEIQNCDNRKSGNVLNGTMEEYESAFEEYNELIAQLEGRIETLQNTEIGALQSELAASQAAQTKLEHENEELRQRLDQNESKAHELALKEDLEKALIVQKTMEEEMEGLLREFDRMALISMDFDTMRRTFENERIHYQTQLSKTQKELHEALAKTIGGEPSLHISQIRNDFRRMLEDIRHEYVLATEMEVQKRKDLEVKVMALRREQDQRIYRKANHATQTYSSHLQ